jgi:hypothetical protein
MFWIQEFNIGACQTVVFGTERKEMIKPTAPVLLLFSALCWAQTSNAAAYPINVHVSSSEWVAVDAKAFGFQRLAVLIDGRKYKLQSTIATGRIPLLALGDYKAKLVEDVHKNTYESSQSYEFQFSDGKRKTFVVVGLTE